MIRFLVLVTLSLFLNSPVFSQLGGNDRLRDSLKHELTIAKNDTSRTLIMADIANAYNGFNSDSSDHYGNKALDLAHRILFLRGEANALIALAFNLQVEGDFPKSFEYLYRGLQIAEEGNFAFEAAVCYANIANGYWFIADYSNAVNFANMSQNLFKKIIGQRGVGGWMKFNILTIGQSYMEDNKLDSAYQYLSQFYKTNLGDKFWYNVALYNLGDCLFRQGDYESSVNLIQKSIYGSTSNGEYLTKSEACFTLSGIFRKTQNPDSSIYYARLGLGAAKSIGYGLGIYKNSKLLAEVYEQLNFKEALRYRIVYDSVNEILYGIKKVQSLQKTLAEEQHRQQLIQKELTDEENRLRQYGFIAGLVVMFLIAFLLFRNNLQRKKAHKSLQYQKDKIQSTLTELKSTQAQLIQSEKMASLGELTAGIAHEIQNPLNFVNNFSEVNTELIDELEQEVNKGNIEEVKALAKDIKENEQKIHHHGKRAGDIVKGMLQHSRSSSGVKEPTDINALADEYLRLAYHGLRAKDKSFNATMRTDFDEGIGNVNVIPQDIGRVILNLITNAFYVVNEKSKQGITGYEPTVSVSTKIDGNKVLISVKDNGNGIPQKILDKIFQPFFTTKPTGQGTGLGLSLSYDIVKAHGGELKVATNFGEGSDFTIQLPAFI